MWNLKQKLLLFLDMTIMFTQLHSIAVEQFLQVDHMIEQSNSEMWNLKLKLLRLKEVFPLFGQLHSIVVGQSLQVDQTIKQYNFII